MYFCFGTDEKEDYYTGQLCDFMWMHASTKKNKNKGKSQNPRSERSTCSETTVILDNLKVIMIIQENA